MNQYGVLMCEQCGVEWAKELPPLWMDEAWPNHCHRPASLKCLLIPGTVAIAAAFGECGLLLETLL